jgi:hypothetical protein
MAMAVDQHGPGARRAKPYSYRRPRRPPSTLRLAPFTNIASSEAK